MSCYLVVRPAIKYIYTDSGYHFAARFLMDNYSDNEMLMQCIRAKPLNGKELIPCKCSWSGSTQHCFLHDSYEDLPKDLAKILFDMIAKKQRCVANKCALAWRCELGMGYDPLSLSVNDKVIYRKN